jgi:hypothetical protein
MIPYCEAIALWVYDDADGNPERATFLAAWWANLDGPITGDIRIYPIPAPPHIPLINWDSSCTQVFRCPFCTRIFFVSDIEQLRHEECPQTMKPERKFTP